MRGHIQGGRFDADYEVDSISAGINQDLQRPVGTNAGWYVYDPEKTTVDPVYDVGAYDGTGRRWRGPYDVPVIRAVIKQGVSKISDKGFYNADSLHLTVNAEDLEKITPGVIGNPDLQDRGRVIWLGEVFRPYSVQQSGVVANRFVLVSIECYQVMPDELINDPQFQKYASPFNAASSIIKTTLPPSLGYGAGGYGDDAPSSNGYGD